MFQSSPAPKGECYADLRRSHRAGRSGFNPHPPRRASATVTGLGLGETLDAFQSSPAPKGECYACHELRRRWQDVRVVSILTRPEGRVLQGRRPAGYAGTLLGDHKPRLNARGTREELRNCNRHVRISEHLHCAYRQVCQERRGAFPPPCANRSAIIDCYRFAHDQTTRGSRISNRGFRPIIKVCL